MQNALQPADGVARRTGRGFVDSFGTGRVCVADGCPTRLSQYNDVDVCWVHGQGERTPSGRSTRRH